MNNFHQKIDFIWNLAEILRHDFRRSEYGRVILPLTVLRRLDCVLQPVKQKILEAYEEVKDKYKNFDPILRHAAGPSIRFYNISRFDFATLLNDPDHIADNLINYMHGFSPEIKEILGHFEFERNIERLHRSRLLYLLIERFNQIDLHPDTVSNLEMGYIFEELIRRFNEASNETAGEHFTPREIVRLMVNLLFLEDEEVLSQPGVVRTLYDPACGTGGMLSVAEEYLHELNPRARLEVFGQEINGETYAICKSDMLLKGHNPANIHFGNTLTQDGFADRQFDYMLTNPPFGVDWKKYQHPIREEHERKGHAGRFGAGLPRVSDGQLLFLQHMLSKLKTGEEGTRLAIVFNGSPLFTGDAGSGESEIRRWIIENDWLEAIIALPVDLFYNTGIATYIWVLTNRKSPERQGKIQLIDATSFYQKMRRSLGKKRNEMTDDHIREITEIYGNFEETEQSKIFPSHEFGYRKVTIERPLRLNYAVTPERLERVQQERAFRNLAASRRRDPAVKSAEEEAGTKFQAQILAALQSIPPGPDQTDDGERVYRRPDAFYEAFHQAMKAHGIKLRAPLKKAILNALSERDEEAAVVVDDDGNPVADANLRDYERVPLEESIHDYFEREVRPFVPDAWINEAVRDDLDGQVGRVGYEINFSRYFYKYQPPRPLEEINREIQELEKEILALLQEVLTD